MSVLLDQSLPLHLVQVRGDEDDGQDPHLLLLPPPRLLRPHISSLWPIGHSCPTKPCTAAACNTGNNYSCLFILFPTISLSVHSFSDSWSFLPRLTQMHTHH